MSQTKITIADIAQAADIFGGLDEPTTTKISAGRIWPAGDEWVGEVGQAPHTHPLDRLFATQDEAQAAVLVTIEQIRDRVADRLHAAGGSAGQIAEGRTRWEAPILYVWDTVEQLEPQARPA